MSSSSLDDVNISYLFFIKDEKRIRNRWYGVCLPVSSLNDLEFGANDDNMS